MRSKAHLANCAIARVLLHHSRMDSTVLFAEAGVRTAARSNIHFRRCAGANHMRAAATRPNRH